MIYVWAVRNESMINQEKWRRKHTNKSEEKKIIIIAHWLESECNCKHSSQTKNQMEIESAEMEEQSNTKVAE